MEPFYATGLVVVGALLVAVVMELREVRGQFRIVARLLSDAVGHPLVDPHDIDQRDAGTVSIPQSYRDLINEPESGRETPDSYE